MSETLQEVYKVGKKKLIILPKAWGPFHGTWKGLFQDDMSLEQFGELFGGDNADCHLGAF